MAELFTAVRNTIRYICKMTCKTSILFLSFFLLVSCGKEKEIIIPEIQNESMEGEFIGNQYKWSRDYDSAHNVVETYDTVFNYHTTLEVDVDSNIIRFDGVVFEIHKPLTQITSEDTIKASWMASMRPIYNIIIVKSQKAIYSDYSLTAPVGPSAKRISGVYLKK